MKRFHTVRIFTESVEYTTGSALYAKKVPIYCGADSMVADGGFATVGVNYVQLGKQVADMVEKIAAASPDG